MRTASPGPVMAHLERQLAQVLRGDDAEAAHEARVACRRLRAWADLTGQPDLSDGLRWLGRGLGPLRDLDVIAATPIAHDARVAPYLLRRYARARESARAVLASPRCSALLVAVAGAAALEPRASRRALRALEAEARRCARRWRHTKRRDVVAQTRALHHLRRALRRLRYAREWAGRGPRALAGPLAAMGRACDLSALRCFLDAWAAQAGLDPHRHRTQLDAGLAEALAALRRGLPRRGW